MVCPRCSGFGSINGIPCWFCDSTGYADCDDMMLLIINKGENNEENPCFK